MKKFHYIAAVALFMISCTHPEETIYVAGSDYTDADSNGSLEAPFNNLESALKEIKSRRDAGHNAKYKIEVAEGNYTFTHSLHLSKDLSDIRIVASKGGKVFFTGGKSLPISSVRGQQINHVKVDCIDLKALGLYNYGKIKNVGFGRPFYNSWAELFVNGKPMSLSRWPNNGMIRMGKIIEKGSIPRNDDFSGKGAIMKYDSLRINTWSDTGDIWISGYFNKGYADDALRVKKLDKENMTITTDGPTLYGFCSQWDWNKWYAFNVKEETDQPGEYYIDRDKGELYFISPDPNVHSLNFSVLEEPFFNMKECSNVQIEGITFEYSRAAMISLCETNNVVIKNCIFRNSGDLAIIIGKGIKPFYDYRHEGTGEETIGTIGSLQQHMYTNQTFNRKGGKNNLIDHCLFYNLGAGAISMGGGNRMTLQAGNNKVSNCLFYSNNRIAQSYRPAIHITGVGNQIANCEIYDTPSMAILMNGNNHIIKNNYIHDVCLTIQDQGAFYYGRNPSECGSILENNLFANIPSLYSTCAVYHDDAAGGLTVKDNIFFQAGKYGVIIGGGSDNRYEGNLFINGNKVVHVDQRLHGWAKAMLQKDGIYQKRLFEVNYNKEPYKSNYPYMKDYWPNDSLPKRNLFTNNTFIGFKGNADKPELIEWKQTTNQPDSIHMRDYSKKALLKVLKERKYRTDKNYETIGIQGEI